MCIGGFTMKYAAKNQLTGTVKEIKRGGVMSQVNLEITAGAAKSSVLTIDVLDDSGIADKRIIEKNK